MTGPPAVGPATETAFREVENKARAFTVPRRVRILGENGRLMEVCDRDQLQRYLDAPNTERVITHGGKLGAIKLLSVGNDLGHRGDRQGSSIVTTKGEESQSEHRWVNGRNVRSGIRHPYSPAARQILI